MNTNLSLKRVWRATEWVEWCPEDIIASHRYINWNSKIFGRVWVICKPCHVEGVVSAFQLIFTLVSRSCLASDHSVNYCSCRLHNASSDTICISSNGCTESTICILCSFMFDIMRKCSNHLDGHAYSWIDAPADDRWWMPYVKHQYMKTEWEQWDDFPVKVVKLNCRHALLIE